MSESQTDLLHVENHGDVVIFQILLDELRELKSCYEVRDQMVQVVDPEKTRYVIFDLSKLEFVGSIGLLGFLAVRRAVPESRLFICGASQSLLEMLSVCRLISYQNDGNPPFEWQSSVEECLKRIQI